MVFDFLIICWWKVSNHNFLIWEGSDCPESSRKSNKICDLEKICHEHGLGAVYDHAMTFVRQMVCEDRMLLDFICLQFLSNAFVLL